MLYPIPVSPSKLSQIIKIYRCIWRSSPGPPGVGAHLRPSMDFLLSFSASVLYRKQSSPSRLYRSESSEGYGVGLHVGVVERNDGCGGGMEYEPGIGGGSTLPCSDRMQGVSCAYNVRGPCRPLKTGFSAPCGEPGTESLVFYQFFLSCVFSWCERRGT
jgi:hypothetical protein